MLAHSLQRTIPLHPAVVIYQAFVGIAYNLLLRQLWTPTGFRALATRFRRSVDHRCLQRIRNLPETWATAHGQSRQPDWRIVIYMVLDWDNLSQCMELAFK